MSLPKLPRALARIRLPVASPICPRAGAHPRTAPRRQIHCHSRRRPLPPVRIHRHGPRRRARRPGLLQWLRRDRAQLPANPHAGFRPPSLLAHQNLHHRRPQQARRRQHPATRRPPPGLRTAAHHRASPRSRHHARRPRHPHLRPRARTRHPTSRHTALHLPRLQHPMALACQSSNSAPLQAPPRSTPT